MKRNNEPFETLGDVLGMWIAWFLIVGTGWCIGLAFVALCTMWKPNKAEAYVPAVNRTVISDERPTVLRDEDGWQMECQSHLVRDYVNGEWTNYTKVVCK